MDVLEYLQWPMDSSPERLRGKARYNYREIDLSCTLLNLHHFYVRMADFELKKVILIGIVRGHTLWLHWCDSPWLHFSIYMYM